MSVIGAGLVMVYLPFGTAAPARVLTWFFRTSTTPGDWSRTTPSTWPFGGWR
jgi:hypothetical protein